MGPDAGHIFAHVVTGCFLIARLVSLEIVAERPLAS
jgi:hypothetical protein